MPDERPLAAGQRHAATPINADLEGAPNCHCDHGFPSTGRKLLTLARRRTRTCPFAAEVQAQPRRSSPSIRAGVGADVERLMSGVGGELRQSVVNLSARLMPTPAADFP